ncbi:3-dehydroquinate synthase [Porphyromonas levii]|uniref:3-dehydroquinate synthase n=1 Tax=Porphyromonas levii TaxID=28114 RepID=UPI001B8C607D|nr:3-dehydroquinate synthase family protein [Porphyromonas levii]MBR8731912.1 3-dehydroquinate synthase [Porphyromonas levii]
MDYKRVAVEIAILDIEDVAQRLSELASSHRVGLLVDETTMELCYPLIANEEVELLVVPEGEEGKQLEVAQYLWQSLLELGYTRQDYLVTLGGGAISDLGGFVASTYMRGLHLVHIPTTLLGMIDASIGGKTAIDFGGARNMVGTFYEAEKVWVSLAFLESLPERELVSGLGELLKYGLLMDRDSLKEVLSLEELSPQLLSRVMQFKLDIVGEDLFDTGKRAQLNLGHTFSHAIEALSLERGHSVPHGIGVAAGIVVALYICYKWHGLAEKLLTSVARAVKEQFPIVSFDCDDYEALWLLALKDKKRVEDGILSMVLLHGVGDAFVGKVSRKQWEEALDFYRDYMG